MRSILVNLDKTKLLKVVEGHDALARLLYWEEKLAPRASTYICDVTKKHLLSFTPSERLSLYRGITKDKIITLSKFEDPEKGINLLIKALETCDLDETPLSTLKKKITLKPVKHTATKSETNRSTKMSKATASKAEPRVKQNGITMPKPKTISAQIFSIADSLSKKGTHVPEKQKILDRAEKKGINLATAATQFSRWKQFHGVE